MLPLTVLAVTVLSTIGSVVPVFLGLTAAKLASGKKNAFAVYGPAISVGILLSTFYDLLQETAGLQLGALNPLTQTFTLTLFLVGLFVTEIFLVRRTMVGELPVAAALVYGWALGIGLHGLGEGIVIGYGFASSQAAFANPTQLFSYGLHKAGEGFTLGTLLVISAQKLNRWAANGLIAGLPVGIGAALGFLTIPAELSTYAFAIGAGFTAYFVTQFSKLLPVRNRTVYGAIAAGFLFMYFAGLLHQF